MADADITLALQHPHHYPLFSCWPTYDAKPVSFNVISQDFWDVYRVKVDMEGRDTSINPTEDTDRPIFYVDLY